MINQEFQIPVHLAMNNYIGLTQFNQLEP